MTSADLPAAEQPPGVTVPAPLVTLSRQYGIGGRAIAECIATQLGVPLMHRQVLARAARAVHVSEQAVVAAEHEHGFISRLLEGLSQYAAGSGGMLTSPELFAAVEQYGAPHIRAAIASELHALADAGSAVVLGHAAALVLSGRTDVLRVFLTAPLPERVRRLVLSRGLTRAKAQELAEQKEAQRAAYCRDWYHRDRYDARLYDLTINVTGRTNEDVAAEIVSRAVALSIRLTACK